MHVGISYGDPTGGLHGAVAVLAALLHRARTGRGQYIDLSQWETSMAVLPEAIVELHHERRRARRATATAIRTWRRTASSAPPARIAGSRSPSRTTPRGAASLALIGRARARRRPALRHPRRAQAARGRARGAGDRVDARRRSPGTRSAALQDAGIAAFVAATNQRPRRGPPPGGARVPGDARAPGGRRR